MSKVSLPAPPSVRANPDWALALALVSVLLCGVSTSALAQLAPVSTNQWHIWDASGGNGSHGHNMQVCSGWVSDGGGGGVGPWIGGGVPATFSPGQWWDGGILLDETRGGNGGSGGHDDGCGHDGGSGGNGGNGGTITLEFWSTNSYGTPSSQSGIVAVSIGGMGGNGGSTKSEGHSSGAGGYGGAGGPVSVYNASPLQTTDDQAYGIWAQSEGGKGGAGADAKTAFYGTGGSGKPGGSGGSVSVTNFSAIDAWRSIPIFAQSIGGNGGDGGSGSGVFGGYGGGGGNGADASWISVTNYASLRTTDVPGMAGI